MANWTSITADDLKAAGHGQIMDRAKTVAVGTVDPVVEEIANAVARVRRAVAAGNPVDADVTKVPGSLKALTVRMAIFALMERIRLSLSDDQKKSREFDNSDLLRIADRKGLVEAPDNIGVSQVPQNIGKWNSEQKLIGRMHPVPPPAGQYPGTAGYANPDAPEDNTR